MMNTISAVASSQQTGIYASQVKPAMYLSEEQYQTPEQVNTIKNSFHEPSAEQQQGLANNGYDVGSEQGALTQENKETIWEAAVAKKYVEFQKSAINAYVVSATGESVYDNDSPDLSITQTYMNLKDFQDEISPLPAENVKDPAHDVSTMPVDKKAEANLEQYQRTQYERVNSLLHLSA